MKTFLIAPNSSDTTSRNFCKCFLEKAEFKKLVYLSVWLSVYFTRKPLCFYNVYSLIHTWANFHILQDFVRYFHLVETYLNFPLRPGLSYIPFRCHHKRNKFTEPYLSRCIFNRFLLDFSCCHQHLVIIIEKMFIFKRASLINDLQNKVP